MVIYRSVLYLKQSTYIREAEESISLPGSRVSIARVVALVMFHNLEISGSEWSAMDGFEDVSLESNDYFIQKGVSDEHDVPNHINGVMDDVEVRDSQDRCLRAKRLRVPSEQAYQQAFQLFYTDIGTPYPCSQSDLDAHNTGTFQEANHRPFVSAIEATKEVMLHNHVTRRVPPTELVAIDNLRTTFYAVEKRMDFGPDLAVKAFADLDLMFFGGQLQHNVRVHWVKASEHPRFCAPRGLWGATVYLPESGKCSIKLNADLHLRQKHEDDPLRLMFGTLLHEMCHAYRVVRCGHSSVKRRGHDEFFGTNIAVVHQRAMRVLGLWAIGEYEPYRQFHFFPGEQTGMGVVVAWMMDVVLNVDDKVTEKIDAAAEAVFYFSR